MRAPRTIVVLASGLCAASCSLLNTFDGYVAQPGSSDAAADVRVEDGGVADSETPDAPSGVDSATDAGGDGATARWCLTQTPQPMFCDDFDDPGAFTKWSDVHQINGATAVRDTSAFTSGPNSLLTSTPGYAMSSPAFLELKSPASMKHVRFAFDYRIDKRDTMTGYAEVAYMHIVGNSDFYMRVGQDPLSNGYTSESYADGGSPVQHNVSLPSSISFDSWRRVSIDLDVGSAHRITMSVDGTNVMNQPLEPNLYVPGPMTVAPGYGYCGYPTGPWRMRFDNVTVDWD